MSYSDVIEGNFVSEKNLANSMAELSGRTADAAIKFQWSDEYLMMFIGNYIHMAE